VTPDRIGRYRVTGVVGAGGFATVLRAEDERLEDEVALKVLAENHSLDPDVRDRFLSEGRVLRRIDSPHVVRVLDLGETDRQQPYLVLELADRGDLATRVARLRGDGWRPGAADVLAIAEPMTAALEAVHRAGVVHRDLSPANVLLRSTLAPDAGAGTSPLVAADERLVLADLGLSKDLARSSGLTLAGGTEGFRPPEQRGGPTTVDARADLWSLSALVVWLLAGEAPTDRRHAERLLRTTDLDAPAREVLVTGLADEPARRQRDVTTWATQLRAALRPPTPDTGDGAEAGTSSRRWQLRWSHLAGAILVGVLLGGAAVALTGGGDDPVTTVTDGTVEVTATDGDLQVTLTGPESVTAGQTATFQAVASGQAGVAWITPEGTVVAGTTSLDVATSSAGGATVTVVATAAGGREVRASHRLAVVDGTSG
jgi:hypothetical protein